MFQEHHLWNSRCPCKARAVRLWLLSLRAMERLDFVGSIGRWWCPWSIFTQIHVQVLEVNHCTETWDTMDTPTKSDLDKSDVFVVFFFQTWLIWVSKGIKSPHLTVSNYPRHPSSEMTSNRAGIPSLNLTWHLKMDVWNTSFLLGWPYFQVRSVSFREECKGLLGDDGGRTCSGPWDSHDDDFQFPGLKSTQGLAALLREIPGSVSDHSVPGAAQDKVKIQSSRILSTKNIKQQQNLPIKSGWIWYFSEIFPDFFFLVDFFEADFDGRVVGYRPRPWKNAFNMMPMKKCIPKVTLRNSCVALVTFKTKQHFTCTVLER